MNYRLTRSHRKTMAIYITCSGLVHVRAPWTTPLTELDAFLCAKEAWIQKHLAAIRARTAESARYSVQYGGLVPFRGQLFPLVARPGKDSFDGETFYLQPGLSEAQRRAHLIALYRRLARDILLPKVEQYADLLKVTPAAVTITSAKTRWGSCSSTHRVNFSWRLALVDDASMDYVVAHELAHIREHNHSKRFWSVLASVMPDHWQRKAELAAWRERLLFWDD